MPAPQPTQELAIELSEADILDAMQQFPGYVDVFADDFRSLYHLAHQHALQRLTAGLSAASLMRRAAPCLSPDMTLDVAAKAVAQSGYKGLAVVEATGKVIGMLTETDYLRRFQVSSFLELLLKLLADGCQMNHRCHHTPVSEAMTRPAVCIAGQAGFGEIFRTFREHPGRSMPVIDTSGRAQGLLLRKDFLNAAHLERLL